MINSVPVAEVNTVKVQATIGAVHHLPPSFLGHSPQRGDTA